MSFFLANRTQCAITGQVLEHRAQACKLPVKHPALLESLGAKEIHSEFVSREAWQQWSFRQYWAQQAASHLQLMYRDGPHVLRSMEKELFVIVGASGDLTIRDLQWLLSFTITAQNKEQFVGALDTALSGGQSQSPIERGRYRVVFQGDAQQLHVYENDHCIDRLFFPRQRLIEWRMACIDPTQPCQMPTFTGEIEGTLHRLRVTPKFPAGAEALGAYIQHKFLQDFLAAKTKTQPHVLGGMDTEDHTELWLRGELAMWPAMAQFQISPSHLAGIPGQFTLDSRIFIKISELQRDGGPWPLQWEKGGGARRLTPQEALHPAQLQHLVTMLNASIGVGTAWLDQHTICYAVHADPGTVYEVAMSWAQHIWLPHQAMYVGQ